jgi:hypothetical protein
VNNSGLGRQQLEIYLKDNLMFRKNEIKKFRREGNISFLK